MATASLIRNDAGLMQQIEYRRELMRRGEITRDNGQGGWTILGKLLDLRYERTAEHPPIPAHLRNYFASNGNVMDWTKSTRKPLIGVDRERSIALIVSSVPPLPDVPDPKFTQQEFVVYQGNRIPLASIPEHYRKRMEAEGVRNMNQKISTPEMLKVRFADHACGFIGQFVIVRPITEGWVQLAGVQAIQKLIFEPRGNDYPGLYLDPSTGEAHFLGGSCDFAQRVGA